MMMAMIFAVFAPVYMAYGAEGTTTRKTTTTRVYRRASTAQKPTDNFYYNQSNRKKYRVASAPVQQREVINRDIVVDDDYEVVNREYETNTRNYEMPNRGADVPNRDYSESYVAPSYADYAKTKQTTETTTTRYAAQERKYFLAHPFFQPLRGNFGSVTDLSYAKNGFEFDLLNGSVLDIDPNSSTYGTVVATGPITGASAKIETSQFLIKEDFSFGITDRLAIIAMGQYDITKVNLKDWSTNEPSVKYSDSGLNVFGIGLQTRFVDTTNWIGMLAGYYQSQKDTADSFIGDLKLGYKIDRTTLYGVARGGYSRLKNGDIYGAYVEDDTGDWLMMSYKTNTKDVMYIEGGFGVFSVLNKYLTLNGEAFFGNYDWHNQLTIKGAFGIQPFDSFALNLYAMGVLYDSADNKVKEYMNYDVNPSGFSTALVYTRGDYKIKNYDEYKIGAQLIFHF